MHIFSRILLIGIFILHLPITAAYAELRITEKKQLDFGVLQLPASGNDSVYINSNGNRIRGNGTQIGGTSQRAKFILKRRKKSKSSVISIDVIPDNSSSPYFTIDQFVGKYGGIRISSFPVGGMPEPDRRKVLHLGATATYNAQLAPGDYNITYDLVILYE